MVNAWKFHIPGYLTGQQEIMKSTVFTGQQIQWGYNRQAGENLIIGGCIEQGN